MKLVTFQSLDAVKDLFEKGYLECNRSKIDIKKAGPTYNWVIEKMNKLELQRKKEQICLNN